MLSGLTRHQMEDFLETHGSKKVHAKAMMRFFYKENGGLWEDTPLLPKNLRNLLAHTPKSPSIRERLPSEESKFDGSIKFLLKLEDHKTVEAVLMPESRRLTLCISSQVGCRQACSFCHTGRMGLTRNLTASEIVGQIVEINDWIEKNPEWLKKKGFQSYQRITNIVFMGMGEPLDNVDAVILAIRIMTDPYGLSLPLRKISVSTAGHLDGLKKLHSQLPLVPVAFSLHCVDDRKRSALMPINRKYPLKEVLSYLENHRAKYEKNWRPFIQFTMIKGVNDDLDTCQKLIELTKALEPKINLIPLNKIAPSTLEPPTRKALFAFQDKIHKAGIRVMVRISKGQDIAGACGQLVTESRK